MEPAARDSRIQVCTVPMEVSWMDVGGWNAYGEMLPPEPATGNRSNCHAMHLKSQNVLALSSDSEHTIATIDCNDLIIVHTPDATLVCPRQSAEKIKDLAQRVDQRLQ
jgi:mannose-1-phosphate guanylyltransferase